MTESTARTNSICLSDIENAIRRIDYISEKLQASEKILQKKYIDSKQDIIEQIRVIKNQWLLDSHLSFNKKLKDTSSVIDRVVSLKAELITMLNSILTHSALVSEQDICSNLGLIENVLINIDVCMQSLSNFELVKQYDSSNIAFIKTNTFLPSDIDFYVFTLDYSPTLHVSDILEIRVCSKDNNISDRNSLDPVKCMIKFPNSSIFSEIKGNALPNNSYQFLYELHVEGTYYLRITLYDTDVSGSPAQFHVNPFKSVLDGTHERLIEAVKKLNNLSSNSLNEESSLCNSSNQNSIEELSDFGFSSICNLEISDTYFPTQTYPESSETLNLNSTEISNSFSSVVDSASDTPTYLCEEICTTEKKCHQFQISTTNTTANSDFLQVTKSENQAENSSTFFEHNKPCYHEEITTANLNIRDTSSNTSNFLENTIDTYSNCNDNSKVSFKFDDFLNLSDNLVELHVDEKQCQIMNEDSNTDSLNIKHNMINCEFFSKDGAVSYSKSMDKISNDRSDRNSDNTDKFSKSSIIGNSKCNKSTEIQGKSDETLDGRDAVIPFIVNEDKRGWVVSGPEVVATFLWRSNHSLNMHFPIGVTSLEGTSDDVIVCDTGNHRVFILNKQTGQVVSSFGKKGKGPGSFYRPSAVVSFNNKFIVKDDLRIQLFSKCGEYLCTFEDCLSRPYGLAVDKLGRVVTLDHRRENPSLYFFSQSGKLVERKKFEPLTTSRRGMKCRFLVADHDKLLVVDLGANCLYGVDLDGNLKSDFGDSGFVESNFWDPAGITLDCAGNIFVADSRNSMVKVFTQNGDFLTTVRFSKAIRRPSGIFLTKSGTLFVVNYMQHNVNAYQLE